MQAVKYRCYGLLLALLCCSASFVYASGSIVLVVDDIGNQRAVGRAAIDIPWVSTVAIMPGRPYTQELAEYAFQKNKEVIIHAPMSNMGDFPLGALGLDRRDGKAQLLANLKQSIETVPHAVGLSNHMGSRLTQDREAMQWVMAELKKSGFYYFDSLTISGSVAWQVAKESDIPWYRRQIFLDHYQTEEFIAAQWQKAVLRAQRGEVVTVICHPYKETLAFFQTLSPTAEELTMSQPLSAVLNYPAEKAAPLPPVNQRNFPEEA